MDSELDDLCRLLETGNSSSISVSEKRASAYEKSGKLCFLWAKLETREDARSLGSCKEWIVKAVDCYVKAMSELREEEEDVERIHQSLHQIVEWIHDQNDPSFVDWCQTYLSPYFFI